MNAIFIETESTNHKQIQKHIEFYKCSIRLIKSNRILIKDFIYIKPKITESILYNSF